MSLTRAELEEMGLESSLIQTIIDKHISVVNAIKKERDTYKADAEKLANVTKERDEAILAAKDAGGTSYKKLYEDLLTENATKATKKAKETACRKLLVEKVGVSEKYADILMKAIQDKIDKMEMDGENIKGSDSIVTDLKTTLKDFIPEDFTATHTPATPPETVTSEVDLGSMSMEDYIAARKNM